MDEKIIINANGETLEITPKQLPVDAMRKRAIESSIALLNLEKVAYIIYIDDKFDIAGQKEEFKARLNNLKDNSNYIVNENFKSLEWEAPAPKFESQVSDLWESSDIKEELLSEVCRHFQDEDSANVIPVLEMKKCYDEKIIVMTPDEWIKDDYKLLNELGDGQKVLCLFDFEFQNGNSLLNGQNGAQLAKALIEKEELSNRFVCGIFSHKFSEEEEEEYRKKYVADYTIEEKRFYTVSKKRYAFDPQISGFAEGIKNLLLHPHVENLKEKALAVLKDSNDKASKKIQDISPATFNQIIQKSSLKEGVWEISTLFRLYGILSKEENFNIISDSLKRQEFNESINKIREIDLIDTGYNSISKNQQLIELRNSELYFKGDIVNKLHLPLSNGDIFEIKGKEYILLVQPCNLALRAKGNECGKRDYSYDVGMLVPLRYIEKNKLNITYEEVKVAESSDKFYAAYFPGFQIISLSILDLAVFNEDGKALINMNSPVLNNDVIHAPWKKRYEVIYKEFTNYETKIIEFNSVKIGFNIFIEQKRAELKSAEAAKGKKDEGVQTLFKEIGKLRNHFANSEHGILEIADLKKFKIDCSKIYDSQTRVLNTEIKRVRHYKSPYSDDLLLKFMLYLSRNAFEHDFTTS